MNAKSVAENIFESLETNEQTLHSFFFRGLLLQRSIVRKVENADQYKIARKVSEPKHRKYKAGFKC